MRILNRTNASWVFFVLVATLFACWLYLGNFDSQRLPAPLRLPHSLVQEPSSHRSVGGTPLGLTFGAIAFAIFIFAGLLGLRKKLPLALVGSVQQWMRAHIWFTLLTVPLVILHTGFRLGGPMTKLLITLYAIVMIRGIYGLVLQHEMPRIMMERLPTESVYEQVPYLRQQLLTAAQELRDSFRPTSAGRSTTTLPPLRAGKTVSANSTPTEPTAPGVTPTLAYADAAAEKAPGGTGAIVAGPKPFAVSGTNDALSEATIIEFLDRQILPYLAARNGKRMRLGNARFAEDTFRFLKLRVTEAYRAPVTDMQAWCDERRMLDLQVKLQHWLHGWLFIHVPISFALILLTAWHAFVTLFYY